MLNCLVASFTIFSSPSLSSMMIAVALSYSVQLLESERIAVTPYDVSVDGLVSPSGFIPINRVAFENH